MARSTSNDVAVIPESQVPELYRSPAMDIDASDVALPRMHIGQLTSDPVKDDLVEKGQLYYSFGQEDPEPVTLEQPLIIHVLALRRGWSWSEKSGAPLERWDYTDTERHPKAWITYDYTLAAPEVSDDIPYKFLLTKSAKPAAQNMNMVIARAATQVPAYEIAFAVTTEQRDNDKGRYWVPRIKHVDATPEGIIIARNLVVLLGPDPVAAQPQGEQPEI